MGHPGPGDLPLDSVARPPAKLGYAASKVPVRQIPFPPTERAEGERLALPAAARLDLALAADLAHPTDHVRMRGRTYACYYEGSRLRIVAWKTRQAAYRVSNTLSLRLSNAQMMAVARSLQRVGQ